MIESDSLLCSKCVNALSGIGFGNGVVVPLDDPPPPPPPVPSPAVVPEPAREVPPAAVFALDEMLVEVLALESTVEFAVDVVDSAEVEFTLDAPAVGAVLLEENADVEDAGVETPDVDEGVKSDVAAAAPALAPAPLEEPAVAEAVAATVPVPVVEPCT